MAGAGEDDAAPPPPSPDRQPMEEAAAAAKRSRSENHHGLADGPSFRMEDLPAEVQPVIISLLPLKEAVRTSIVSRSWTTLWRFHCDLCFDVDSNTDDNSAHQVNGTGTNDQSTNRYNTKITRAKFMETVNSVIQRHSGIGINKFSISCDLHKEDSHHLDKWIRFAASSKAKIIDFHRKISDYRVEEAPHFPLEALDAQGSSFVQSLSLASVSIKPRSGICRFTILRRLVLSSVQIFGDFPGLLAKCSRLEDLEIKWCSGVDDLIVPHTLDKLQHLLIAGMDVQMVEFHATDLAHFEYKGRVTPIVLHGCLKLEKATIAFEASNVLPHAFNVIPSISPVKILIVRAFISKYGQSLELPLRPQGMFMHLRHMTCKIIVLARDVNDYNGVLQLAHWLDSAPRLETLDLHLPMQMSYLRSGAFVSAEVAGVEAPCMRRHDHLKTVFMSGFQCYKSQIELACCILGNASVLEQLTVEAIWGDDDYGRICEWAEVTSKRFGKVITVLDAPLNSE
nr:F-box/FBD/LRR-repeat protein At1g13570 isoform X2 [Aegilops tauschii subsp. strangulata]